MIVFQDQFTLTDRLGYNIVRDTIEPDIGRNEFSSRLYDSTRYYWSLPERFLGNQIKSYGGQLNFTVTNEGGGEYEPDQDVILTGNGLTLFWTRRHPEEGVIKFLLHLVTNIFIKFLFVCLGNFCNLNRK